MDKGLMSGDGLKDIDGRNGYFVGQMSEHDRTTLTELIREQYITRLLSFSTEYSSALCKVGMNQYHSHSSEVPHQNLWPKRARILGPCAVEKVKSLPFFQRLTAELGVEGITGEDGCGWEEIYWRIVRPGNSDIGDLHADKWFWDLGHGSMPAGFRRIKIWIAICSVPGKSGLRLIPGSHLKQDWKYHGEVDATGKTKPKFDEDLASLDIVDIHTSSGDFIVFHDELIHGGMANLSNETRVSLEATLLVRDRQVESV